MKSLTLAIILSVFLSNSFAQTFHIGFHRNMAPRIQNLSRGDGGELYIGYNMYDNLELRATAGLYGSDLAGRNSYLPKEVFGLGYFEAAALYQYYMLPMTSFYTGGGLGYYSPFFDFNRNEKIGNIIISSDFEDAVGVNLLTGIRFSPIKLISIQFEAKYLFLTAEHSAFSVSTGKFNVKSNLNTLSGKFGLTFNF